MKYPDAVSPVGHTLIFKHHSSPMRSLCTLFALLLCSPAIDAQWQQLLEHDGGPLYAWSATRTPDGVVWLGTDNGLFTSANNGATWARHPSVPFNWKVKSVRNYGNEIIVLALQRLDPSTVKAWLNRSFDAGSSWKTSLIDVQQQPNGELMYSTVFKSDSTLFVHYGDGLFRSNDEGSTWELVLGGSLLIQNSCGNDSIVAATYRSNYNGKFALYISRDKGTSWQQQTLPGQTSSTMVRGILVHGNRVLAAMTNRKIAVSTDWGATWIGQDLPSTLPNTGYALDISYFRWDETSGRPVANFDYQYFSSPDGGLSWVPETPEPFYSLADFLPEGNRLSVIGSRGFATRATAGAMPAVSNNGIFASSPTVVKVFGNEIYAAFNNALFRSADAGANWTKFNIPILLQADAKPVVDLEKSGDTLFLLTQKGLILSADHGSTWSPSYVLPLLNGYRLMFGFSGELWIRTGYSSVSVVDRHKPSTVLRLFDSYIDTPSDQGFDLLILPGSNLILAPGFSYDNLYASADSGKTWVIRSSFGNGSRPSHLLGLASGRLLAYGLNGAPYYSDDEGLSWKKAALIPATITSISQIVETPDGLFAASTLHGLLKSTDNGQTWSYPPNGAPGANFSQIACATELSGGIPSTRLYVGATNKGVWKFDPSTPDNFAMTGVAQSCSGGTETYCVPATAGNAFHTWTGPAGAHIEGQGNVLVLKGPGGECVDIKFGQSGGYVSVVSDDNSYPVSRAASKFVGLSNPPPTILPPVTVAYEDLPFNSPLTGAPVKNYPGQYIFIAGPFASQSGCDSTVLQTVKVSPPLTGTALGTVYWDYNNDGAFSAGVDELAGGVIVQGSSGVFTTTSAVDVYSLTGLQAGDTIRAAPTVPGTIVTPAYYIYQPGLWANHNFRFFAPSPGYDLTVDLTGLTPFRPGFDNNVKISVRNIGLATAQNAVVRLAKPAFIHYQGAFPPPDAVMNDTLTWNIGALAYDSAFQISVEFYTPTGIPVGTNVPLTGISLPVSDDGNPANNFYTLKSKVVNSFDPNDKQVDPEYITPSMLANGQALEYTVRFQNTGNFPAEFVRIVDTLSQNLDPGTFHFISSSHPCTWSLRGRGVVEFLFDNIQLSDTASDEAASHGFVKFSVQPKKNLVPGVSVQNFCDIYFDFNPPVRTNSAETKVVLFLPGDGLVIKNKLLQLRPNPAAFHVFAKWNQPAPEAGRIRLFDTTGFPRLETYVEAGSSETSIDIQSLPPGLYFVLLEAGDLILANKVAVVQPDILGTGF